MLIIQRRAGESILIADNIEIQVIETTASRVKLGITAPKSVLVIRKETAQTRMQNKLAAQPPALSTISALASQLRDK